MAEINKMQKVVMRVLVVMLVASSLLAAMSITRLELVFADLYYEWRFHQQSGQHDYCSAEPCYIGWHKYYDYWWERKWRCHSGNCVPLGEFREKYRRFCAPC